MISDQIRTFLLSHAVYRDVVPRDLTDDFPLLDSGVLDSVGVFEMVIFLEDKLGVKVATEDVVESNFRDVSAIARFVENKRRATAP